MSDTTTPTPQPENDTTASLYEAFSTLPEVIDLYGNSHVIHVVFDLDGVFTIHKKEKDLFMEYTTFHHHNGRDLECHTTLGFLSDMITPFLGLIEGDITFWQFLDIIHPEN